MRVIATLLALLLCQCAGPTRVSPEEFKSEYALIPMAQTMHNVEYLGQREGAAYINHQSMSLFTGKFKDRVIYTPLEDFDPAFRASLPVEGRTTLDLLREQEVKAKPHRAKIAPKDIDAILNDPNRTAAPSTQPSGHRDFQGDLKR
jgi:hypothetical protein